MDITETRRANLRRWVAEHGTPYKEKSLFSQLKSTGSFGERVARRLEDQYGMGEKFLDASQDQEVVATPVTRVPDSEPTYADAERLLALYRRADKRGRAEIMAVAMQEGAETSVARHKA